MLDLLQQLAQYGAMGVVAALSIAFAWYKDKQQQQQQQQNSVLTNQLIEGYRQLSVDLAKLINFSQQENLEHDKKETPKLEGSDKPDP